MGLSAEDLRDIRSQVGTPKVFHGRIPPSWTWVVSYDDVGPCIELMCLWDDSLKKDDDFCNFAILLAQEILGGRWDITWGKWGARLEADNNPSMSRGEMEEAAERVRHHPSWLGLAMATHVFTYGGC